MPPRSRARALLLTMLVLAACAPSARRAAPPAAGAAPPAAPLPTAEPPRAPEAAITPRPAPSATPAPSRRAEPHAGSIEKPPAAEPFEGFGAGTQGGAGGRVVVIDDPSEEVVQRAFADVARSGRAILRFAVRAPIVLTRRLPRLTAPYVTIEGNGATIDGSAITVDAALVDVRTHDVIVRDLRLRNGYDNLRLNGPEAHDIVVSHVSSTGARDDGISIAFGAHDATVQYAFVAGNTRGLFMKYAGTTNVTIHHSWFQKNAIRSPLVAEGALADLRNIVVEDWGEWASRFEHGASGNLIASLYALSPYARLMGGHQYALRFLESGPVFTSLNVFRGDALPGETGAAAAPISTPPVRTHAVEEMEPIVRARAGCLPRDRVDRAYVDLRDGWKVGEETPLRLAP